MTVANGPSSSPSLLRRYWWVAGLAIALLVVAILAPRASSDPDGLEKVAEDKEFVETGKDNGYEWLPDYTIPGVGGDLSTVLAGAVGVVVVFGVIVFLGRSMTTRRGA